MLLSAGMDKPMIFKRWVAGDITIGRNIIDTAGGMITGTAQSSLRASGIIGTTANPVDVNINGDLWVWAGSEQDEVSVITQGTIIPTSTTERVEIYEPSPPGLVIHDNRLMGGANYGSGSAEGSILSRGYGESQVVRTNMFDLFYERALQPWGYTIATPWVPQEGALISEGFIAGPIAIVDATALGIELLPQELLVVPEQFKVNTAPNYYIIRPIAK